MPANISIKDRKRALRQQASERRRAAAAADDGSSGERLIRNFAEAIAIPAGATVAGFWPIESEIDVMQLLRHLGSLGHGMALPVVVGRGHPLLFRRWREEDVMEPGPFGIPEPTEAAPEVTPNLVLVPMLAFDRAGYRLGYGAAYYDMSLAALRRRTDLLAVGIAYAGQEVAAVPREDHDQPVDWIVTEKEVIKI